MKRYAKLTKPLPKLTKKEGTQIDIIREKKKKILCQVPLKSMDG